MSRRVVITGCGPVTALGIGMEEFSPALLGGESGVLPCARFHVDGARSTQAACVEGLDVDEFLEAPKAYLDPASAFALAATALALEHAELDLKALDRDGVGLCLGSAWGAPDTMARFFKDVVEKGPRFGKPFLFPHTYSNTAISVVAMEHGIGGPHMSFASGAVASMSALAAAVDTVREGRARVVLAGGCDALCDVVFRGYDSQGVLSPGSSRSAPFDAQRSGYSLGEAGVVVVVEDREHANGRGAHIMAEISGVGMGGGSRAAMKAALRALPEAPGAVVAHANGSIDGDATEADAIVAEVGNTTPVTSIKSLTGETVGASGGLQVAAACVMLKECCVPAIGKCEVLDPAMAMDVVHGSARQRDLNSVLVNSVDPGGAAVSLLLARDSG